MIKEKVFEYSLGDPDLMIDLNGEEAALKFGKDIAESIKQTNSNSEDDKEENINI